MNKAKMGRPKTTSTTKHCVKCNKTKSRKYFYSTSAYCKKCQRIAVIDNQKKKAHYYNQYRYKYEKHHPEKTTAWKKAAIKRWEKKHGMKYTDFVRLRRQIRLSIDPHYREKIAQQNKKQYQARKEKQKKYRIAYNIENREILRLKARERYYKRSLLRSTDDDRIDHYQKQITNVQENIKTLNSTRKNK